MTDTTHAANLTGEEHEPNADPVDSQVTSGEGEESNPAQKTDDELTKWKASSRKHEAAKKEALRKVEESTKKLEEANKELELYRKAEESRLDKQIEQLSDDSKRIVESLFKKGISKADALDVLSDIPSEVDARSQSKQVRPNGFSKQEGKPKSSARELKRQDRIESLRREHGLV